MNTKLIVLRLTRLLKPMIASYLGMIAIKPTVQSVVAKVRVVRSIVAKGISQHPQLILSGVVVSLGLFIFGAQVAAARPGDMFYALHANYSGLLSRTFTEQDGRLSFLYDTAVRRIDDYAFLANSHNCVQLLIAEEEYDIALSRVFTLLKEIGSEERLNSTVTNLETETYRVTDILSDCEVSNDLQLLQRIASSIKYITGQNTEEYSQQLDDFHGELQLEYDETVAKLRTSQIADQTTLDGINRNLISALGLLTTLSSTDEVLDPYEIWHRLYSAELAITNSNNLLQDADAEFINWDSMVVAACAIHYVEQDCDVELRSAEWNSINSSVVVSDRYELGGELYFQYLQNLLKGFR